MVLSAIGSTAVAAAAGCQRLRSQSFEASPVVLTDSGQRDVRLGETTRDVQMTERTVVDGVTVSITSHAAVYTRAAGLGGE